MNVEMALDEQKLCMSCGLCCDGSLFAWVKLRPAELFPAEAAGLRVYGAHPADRGFAQPCSAFVGHCAIYTSGFYPKGCLAYRCSLLKRCADGTVTVEEAARIISKTKTAAVDLRAAISLETSGSTRPDSDKGNFPKSLREGLSEVTEEDLERLSPRSKAAVVEYLRAIMEHFGVSGIKDALLREMD